VTSVQNAGLAFFPLMIAAVFNASNSRYIPNCEYFFMAISIAGILIGIRLNFLDYYNGNILNSPSAPPVVMGEGKVRRVGVLDNYNFQDERFPVTDAEAMDNTDV
jgi:hypothetical protein